MVRSIKSALSIVLAILFILAVTPESFSQKKSREKLPKGAVRLEYNFKENKPVSFLSATKIVWTMDYEGQTFEVNITSNLGCTVKSTGKQDKNLKLEIHMDTLYNYVETPQGSSGGSVKEVEGKVFNMVLSPYGGEMDLSEAEKIKFTIEGSGERNLGESFISYFPDLPKKPVKKGEKWVANDTIKSTSATSSIQQTVQSENTFEGIEKVDGIDCAKITSVLTGSRDQKAQNMGMDVRTKGNFTGTEELYFAIKEGYYIKQVVKTKLNGNVDLTGDQGNMSFPMVEDLVSTNAIRK